MISRIGAKPTRLVCFLRLGLAAASWRYCRVFPEQILASPQRTFGQQRSADKLHPRGPQLWGNGRQSDLADRRAPARWNEQGDHGCDAVLRLRRTAPSMV